MPNKDLPPSDIPHNFRVIPVRDVRVSSWTPGKLSEHLPPIEVHLIISMLGGEAPFVMRYKSAEALQSLIDALVEHKEFVWPEDPELTSERIEVLRLAGKTLSIPPAMTYEQIAAFEWLVMNKFIRVDKSTHPSSITLSGKAERILRELNT